MAWIRGFILLAVGGALLPASAAETQAQRYPYERRGDREEGIHRLLISGERFDIISAVLEAEGVAAADANTLVFYLTEAAQVDINVREYVKQYRMHPLVTDFAAGANTYSWPTEITNHYEIKPGDLSALAIVKGARPNTIAPIAIGTRLPLERLLGYSFMFEASASVDVRLQIANYEVGEVVYRDSLLDQPAREDIEFFWELPATIESGVYRLSTEAVLKRRSGSERTIHQAWYFYHPAH